MASLARLVPGRDGRAVREAAAGFERAGYTAWAHPEPPAPAAGAGLRAAARLLTAARYLPRTDTRRLLALLAQLAALGDAIERMRQAQHRAHQADAAHRAAHTLRTTAPVPRPDDDLPAMPPVRPHTPGLTAPGMTR